MRTFDDLNSKNPKIKEDGDKIILYPVYWNYNLLITSALILVICYVLKAQSDPLIDVVCILILGGLAVITIVEFAYYNTVTIDVERKSMSIKPNPIYRLLSKTRIILFKNIKKIDFKPSISSPEFRRYLINLTLKDSERLKLISTPKKEIAIEISNRLSRVVQ